MKVVSLPGAMWVSICYIPSTDLPWNIVPATTCHVRVFLFPQIITFLPQICVRFSNVNFWNSGIGSGNSDSGPPSEGCANLENTTKAPTAFLGKCPIPTCETFLPNGVSFMVWVANKVVRIFELCAKALKYAVSWATWLPDVLGNNGINLEVGSLLVMEQTIGWSLEKITISCCSIYSQNDRRKCSPMLFSMKKMLFLKLLQKIKSIILDLMWYKW